MNARRLLAAWLGLLPLLGSCAPARSPAPQQEPAPPAASHPPATAATPARVDFETQIRPILASRCQPCHFEGGKMYAELPFDRAQTIRDLGEKLFTRIRDEREQVLLRSFLTQTP